MPYQKCINAYVDNLTEIELKALRAIRNSIAHQGRMPSVRELMFALGYKSPRSAAIVIARLIEKKILRKKDDGGGVLLAESNFNRESQAQTVNVPLVGTVACGIPQFAEENVEAMLPVSVELARPPYRYYFLRASGDSMNLAGIEDGNMLLVRQQSMAHNGDIVIACIDGEVTVKEIYFNDDIVILKPKSTNPVHQPVILSRDFLVQGVMVKVIPGL